VKRYDERTYGDRIAGIYDELYGSYEESTVDLLQELARGGRALELGIGTGRVALPLHRRGVHVTGIDSSQAMIDKLHAKPGGPAIEVVQTNFASFDLDARFDLIYVLVNTLFGLLTQEEQVQCFQTVAAHLAPEGVFLVEAFVPDVCRFDRGQTIRVPYLDEDEVRLDVTRHNLVEQHILSQHVVCTEEGIRLYPVRLRYIWPSEMDLMARLAGLELKHRWSSWDKGAFGAKSEKHISVYGV
jgi:SAM-dependent methyltransferase